MAFGLIVLVIIYSMLPSLLPKDVVMDGLLFVLVMAVSAVFLKLYHRKVVPIELDPNWLGFDHLELGKSIDEVVGGYGEEVGYWKNRTGRSE